MRIAVIGAGYVGLVTGTCLAELGHEVLLTELDTDRVAQLSDGQLPLYEPGLRELVVRNLKAGRLRISTALEHNANVYFVCVGTPAGPDGSADTRAVLSAANAIGEHPRPAVVAIKSTVPLGTCDRIQELLPYAAVVSNPEFLAEGTAVRDFFYPDRVVVGGPQEACERILQVYAPLKLTPDRILVTDRRSSELVKYASNTMLAMRVSFMNEVAQLCHAAGADIRAVRLGVGADSRIGKRFLYAGPGYGGSCLHGRETVLFRRSGRIALATLSQLFRDVSAGRDDPIEPMGIAVDGLDVLALAPGEVQPRFFPCRAVTRRPFEGEAVRLRTKMGRRITCTPDHPFVVIDPETGATNIKLCRDLTDRDWLPLALAPHHAEGAPAAIDVLEALEAAGIRESEVIVRLDEHDRETLAGLSHDALFDALDHPRGRERSYDIKRNWTLRLNEARRLGFALTKPSLATAKNGTYVPRHIPLDARFWRIVGLYLSEGHRSVDGRRHRLAWSFHPSAEAALVDEVAGYWRDLGVKCDVRSGTTSMNVSLSSRLLAGVFIEALKLGASCYEHRLPDLAWTITTEHRMALLSGLWHGDGSWSYVGGGPSIVLEYGTVSRDLADGIVRLLSWHGIVARVKSERMRKSTRDAWFVIVTGANQVERMLDLVKPEDRADVAASIRRQSKRIAPMGYRRIAPDVAIVRVVSKETHFHRGPVFSLEVDGAQTIATTGGLVVHNCFPKDVQALVALGQEHKTPMRLARAAHLANEDQALFILKLVQDACGGSVDGKKVALWGLAFKPETDDVREAPALRLAAQLLREGAHVVGHDPEAGDNFRRACPQARVVDKQEDALDGAHALVLLTEWRCYRAPDFEMICSRLAPPRAVVDGRNIWRPEDARAAGLLYQGIGA